MVSSKRNLTTYNTQRLRLPLAVNPHARALNIVSTVCFWLHATRSTGPLLYRYMPCLCRSAETMTTTAKTMTTTSGNVLYGKCYVFLDISVLRICPCLLVQCVRCVQKPSHGTAVVFKTLGLRPFFYCATR